MGSHLINLAVRFLLELSALFAAGMWGWRQTDQWPRFLLAIGIPIILAVIWTTFAVPNDPSRSGNAPVVTPGIVRLVIELGFFSFATWTLYDMGFPKISLTYGFIVTVHYLVSYDRIKWLIAH